MKRDREARISSTDKAGYYQEKGGLNVGLS